MLYTLRQIKDGTGFARDARFEQVTDYNGWSNRETWAVALYINNDQEWQESVFDAVRGVIENQLVNHHTTEVPAYKVGEAIRENVEGVLLEDDDDEHSAWRFQRDTLHDIGSLWRVNWDEIGAAFLADVKTA